MPKVNAKNMPDQKRIVRVAKKQRFPRFEVRDKKGRVIGTEFVIEKATAIFRANIESFSVVKIEADGVETEMARRATAPQGPRVWKFMF